MKNLENFKLVNDNLMSKKSTAEWQSGGACVHRGEYNQTQPTWGYRRVPLTKSIFD